MIDNPKDIAGSLKAPLNLLPGSALHAASWALKHGADKYGPFNWRDIPIKASNYTAAAMRHIKAWEDGENDDPESKVHHIAHAIAGLMILYDAKTCRTLIDDRPPAWDARTETDYPEMTR